MFKKGLALVDNLSFVAFEFSAYFFPPFSQGALNKMKFLFFALLCVGAGSAKTIHGKFYEVVQRPDTGNATIEHLDKDNQTTSYKKHDGTGFFQQILDHDDPLSRTFSQRYMYNTKFWKGPGSPIIMISVRTAMA